MTRSVLDTLHQHAKEIKMLYPVFPTACLPVDQVFRPLTISCLGLIPCQIAPVVKNDIQRWALVVRLDVREGTAEEILIPLCFLDLQHFFKLYISPAETTLFVHKKSAWLFTAKLDAADKHESRPLSA